MPSWLRSAVLLLALTVPVEARDGRDVFTGVLQGFIGELERQQKNNAYQQQQDANAILQACFQGSGPACDIAIKHPGLNPSVRGAVRSQRQALAAQRLASQRAYEEFTAQWTACRDQNDMQSCDAALTYGGVSPDDRQVLLGWRDGIVHRAEEERRTRDARLAAERERQAAAEAQARAARPAIADVAITTGSIAPAPSVPHFAFDAVAFQKLSILVFFGFCGAVAVWLTRSAPTPSRVGANDAPFASHTFAAETEPLLPLTGHFPTDVRRALAC